MNIANIDQIKHLDKTAMELYKIPQDILMENASISAYEVIKKEFDIHRDTFAVFCGPGNNGGDGMALARKLHSRNADVIVVLLGKGDKYAGSSATNYSILQSIDIPIYSAEDIGDLDTFIATRSVLVDAILGVGLDREVSGIYRGAIAAVNSSDKKVLSLDIPSGINGNTGEIMGSAVIADFTISFGVPKLGNLLYPGYKHNGVLYVSKISFPSKLYSSLKTKVNTPTELPKRMPDSHKGSYGRVLFIGGGGQYYGAPFFNSMGFLKAGGGYSRLACPKAIVPVLASRGSEIVFHPMEVTENGNLSKKCKEEILELSSSMRLVVLGGGMSTEEDTQELIKSMVSDVQLPIIIDADGIRAISKNLQLLLDRKHPTILTPHLGELSSLLGMEIEEIKKNQVELCREFCCKFGVILVVKGAHSQVYCPDGSVYINMSGCSALATAGSGDVLCGVIAAQYALGMNIETSARNGVFLHGFCSELISKKKGEDGVVASDLLEFLPKTMKLFRENYEDIKKYYSICEI